MQSTRVAFVTCTEYPFTGEVTAVFLDLPERQFLTCYAHVGQHDSCAPEWVNEQTRHSTPEEFAPLLKELRHIYEGNGTPEPPIQLILTKWKGYEQ